MSLVIPIDEALSLRLIEPEHAEEIAAVVLANMQHVGQRLPWCTPAYDVEGCRAWIAASRRGYEKRRQMPLSLIEYGRVIGGSGFAALQYEEIPAHGVRSATGDIGYWLAEQAQGRGAMTRAVGALVDYGFERLALDRITIRAEPDNLRSCAVAERLWFAYEGTLRHVARWNGRWVDHRLYAMLAENGLPKPRDKAVG